MKEQFCIEHSGLVSKIEGIGKDLDNHKTREHQLLNERLDKIDKKLDRLPNWATFIVAMLSSLATYGLTH